MNNKYSMGTDDRRYLYTECETANMSKNQYFIETEIYYTTAFVVNLRYKQDSIDDERFGECWWGFRR